MLVGRWWRRFFSCSVLEKVFRDCSEVVGGRFGDRRFW